MSRMPVVFIGHGSPMNALEDNDFTKNWRAIAAKLPRPQAILCISAHWFTEHQLVGASPQPEMIDDFYGFPAALSQVRYPAPGSPDLARRIAGLFPGGIGINTGRGLDHGVWSVLTHMYPEADIPVVPLSVNATNTPAESYRAGQWLRPLRDEGILILGSGNVVHNLRLMNRGMVGGYPWAIEFDNYIKNAIVSGDHRAVYNLRRAGEALKKSFHHRDHFDPLLYFLGAAEANEPVAVYNQEYVMGSMSMTSYVIG